MQPESFPTDDSLGRSVQPASAPLSAKEGAFGEENAPYEAVFGDVSKIIDAARESAVRSVNAAMTAAYWLVGRRIVEFEQSGEERAEYGAALIERLAEDLTVTVRTRFLPSEHLQHASVLSLISARPDFPDIVWKSWLHPLDSRFSRRRLENSIPHPSRWPSTTFSRPSHCPGPHTSGCCRSRTNTPASSMRPRRCEADGRSASSTGRSAPSSTSERPSRRTGPPC